MKKIFVALFFAFLFSSVGYVAVSKNIQPQTVEHSGCCSHHGGVAYCGKSGYFICNDGTQSPSCTCR